MYVWMTQVPVDKTLLQMNKLYPELYWLMQRQQVDGHWLAMGAGKPKETDVEICANKGKLGRKLASSLENCPAYGRARATQKPGPVPRACFSA